jgi:FkbM family methyltransferase
MQIPESLKLFYRAWKYRLQEDRAEIAFLRRRVTRGMTVFDIGAHKGGYTYWMARAAGRSGTVVAFEPQEAGAALLGSLFNGAVRVERLAVADREGTARFFIQPQPYSVSFEASIVDKYENATAVEVHLTTIDSYCRSHHLAPHFIKIDVEGFEWEVLTGGSEVLAACRPLLLIEIEERHIGLARMNELFSFLEARGYEGFFFDGGKRSPLSAFDHSVHQDPRSLQTDKRRYCNNFIFEPRI